MEELNIEELKKKKVEIQERLENNAETIRKSAEELDNINNCYRRKQLINSILGFFSNTFFAVAFFTLGDSTFTNVLGWIFAICAGLILFILIIIFVLLRIVKKQIDTITDINANLEKELKEINDKLEAHETNIKKTRRSKK